MINVVKSIIDIDKQANERLEKAVNEKEEIIEKAKEETKKIREKLEQDAINRIKKTEAMHNKMIDEEMMQLNAQKEKVIKEMDDYYAKHHMEIEESIYRRIVGE